MSTLSVLAKHVHHHQGRWKGDFSKSYITLRCKAENNIKLAVLWAGLAVLDDAGQTTFLQVEL